MASKSPLDVLYSAFHKAENRVGGGEGLVGIYGSMTQHGTSAMLAAMVEHTGLGPDSVLVDIGSGLCRPLLHASVEQRVELTYGVELDAVKCQKADPFVKHTVAMLADAGVMLPAGWRNKIICMSAEELGSLEPATHVYAAWEGFPSSAMRAVGRLFRHSPTCRAITIVQRSLRNQDPTEVMAELGFGAVQCKAAAIPVFMAGSGRKLNAYVFVKTDGANTGSASVAGQRTAAERTSRTRGPAQAINEDSEEEEGRDSAPPTGPSLDTAPEFNPAQVIAELGRMASGSSPGRSTVDRTASGHGLRSRADSGPLSRAGSGQGSGSQPAGAGAGPATPSTVRSLARATARLNTAGSPPQIGLDNTSEPHDTPHAGTQGANSAAATSKPAALPKPARGSTARPKPGAGTKAAAAKAPESEAVPNAVSDVRAATSDQAARRSTRARTPQVAL